MLLTGATGFVGRAVYPALIASGWRVRGLSRDATAARRRWPTLDWAEGDTADEASCGRALTDCEVALYLVHGIGERGGFRAREVESARRFARAAASAGVRRLVYLGGIAPERDPSDHLRSRIEVGGVLRAGAVPTLELRASMIIGQGSLSWLIVRDLAARLPVMVLPRWLASRTEPVAIDDVVVALVRALELPCEGSACFDVPGPDVMSGRQILEATASVLGLRRPLMLEVPLLSPRLSSLWVRFVTRAEWSVAREVVIGLRHDLIARDERFWTLVGHRDRLHFEEAARRAVVGDRHGGPVVGTWGRIERVLARERALPS